MPLISARNPDVLDVANFEDDANSSLMKRTSLTLLEYTPEDVLSVMTMHSAFQSSPNGSDPLDSPVKLKNATNNLNSFFRRSRQSTSRIEEHVNIASDEFSVNSLPIQNCDVASVEEMWMKEQQTFVEPTPKIKRKKFSTQTYSDKGTVYSPLRTQMTTFSSDNQSVCTKSVATATLGENSYFQNAYKSYGAARRLSEIVKVHVTDKYNKSKDERAREEDKEKGQARRDSHPPRPKPSRCNSRSSVSSTKDETESVGSHRTTSSSNHTSESKLERDMYRLSLELANTLANLDISNSEFARFRKQVKDLQVAVQTLKTEKKALNERLESYEQKKSLVTELKPDIEVDRNKEWRVIESACVIPSRGAGRQNEESRPLFSPGANSSFSDPGVNSREESGLLFPDLNENHISCPDVYGSKVHDKLGTTIEDAYRREQNEQNTSVELIDPRDEVFDDDPFATHFNYSNDSSVSIGNCADDDDGDTVYSKALSIAQTAQERVNTTTFTTATALEQWSKKLPMFRKKAKDVLNTSFESQLSHMKNMANVAPSKREKAVLNQSNSTINLSRLFKFGNNGNDDDLSVSIQSQVSRPNFFKFGR